MTQHPVVAELAACIAALERERVVQQPVFVSRRMWDGAVKAGLVREGNSAWKASDLIQTTEKKEAVERE